MQRQISRSYKKPVSGRRSRNEPPFSGWLSCATPLPRIFQNQALRRREPPVRASFLAQIEIKRTSFVSHKSSTNFHELGYIKKLMIKFLSEIVSM